MYVSTYYLHTYLPTHPPTNKHIYIRTYTYIQIQSYITTYLFTYILMYISTYMINTNTHTRHNKIGLAAVFNMLTKSMWSTI
jgi:hypothetical protein